MRKQSTLKKAGLSLAVAALMTAAASGNGTPAQDKQSFNQAASFAVDFTDCVESIGVCLAPTASVRGYVPTQFILAGEGQPVTPLVVRTAHCRGIDTAGHERRRGDIVQIGAAIVPPDRTGDINNYTIWYYTSDIHLAEQLRQAGVSVQYTPNIDYDNDTDDNTLHVRVPLPGVPRIVLSGTVSPSRQPIGSFVANWWQEVRGGRSKMSTNVPLINIGAADLMLTTNPNVALGRLIGASPTGFPIIQQFNTFGSAQMQVTLAH